ncbi:hydroxylamine reductase [Campylobacter sputorum subsp. bubulus]|uniref:Hydroxylamine reductase n=1 Tax=Campylobacter sputorum subsp. sputorum TaxID=32024 RepID=A0A381DGQ0_9BACT|nr:hydroxylamine reductase [Campylobacter sputorum]ASM34920.1 putative hydroxylamine reductase [Campylobacter sputorum aubsp. sputorum RM3237]ASM36580.1 putative hydroxylamine reductase [Campylobacter sputorum bv. faecalis CCUG 20703]KAB0581951.1 hydroxylamine reductase [Campylobacter sputorum subsp. sputorum]QEL05111.1 putative hydroxylamine reductase [Campylobacter sputorum subsp. sputorum]SUX09409.1 hydroxylamine reductase [Campylobacter sputorum subsp. sputorum]
MSKENLEMFCHQCEMSAPGGCGSKGQSTGTCGKDSTLANLQDMMIFGLKGMSAYRHHANELGFSTKEVDDVIADTLYFTLTNSNFNFDEHIAQVLKVGEAGVKVMDILSSAHTTTFGIPSPVKVTQNKASGKAILVSGHNLFALNELLKQTAGKGINIYTHSEMLPAHGYPELRKYKHLKGNIGKSWFDQTKLFNEFKGAILMTTNCIVPLRSNCEYAHRLFGYSIAGTNGVTHIQNDDFSPLIKKALSLPEITGFDSDEYVITGGHYKAILPMAGEILEALKDGKIRRFFVIAGCDAPGKGRDYYRELAISLPKDCIILTSSCGKFRFNDIDFGVIEGTNIPRYIDLGQCNDSNGAVKIALALSEATGIEINDLPVSIVLMWMEQKAVIILMALLYLGIKNVHIGPSLPEFFNDKILNFLVEKFNITLISSDTKTDLKKFLNE